MKCFSSYSKTRNNTTRRPNQQSKNKTLTSKIGKQGIQGHTITLSTEENSRARNKSQITQSLSINTSKIPMITLSHMSTLQQPKHLKERLLFKSTSNRQPGDLKFRNQIPQKMDIGILKQQHQQFVKNQSYFDQSEILKSLQRIQTYYADYRTGPQYLGEYEDIYMKKCIYTCDAKTISKY